MRVVSTAIFAVTILLGFAGMAYMPTFAKRATANATSMHYRAGDIVQGRCVGALAGDMMLLESGDKRLRVELAGVDAPDAGESMADASKRSLADLAYNKPVFVKVEKTDRSGLITGYASMGTLSLNLAQIGRGMARTRVGEADPAMTSLEARAKSQGRGVWEEEFRQSLQTTRARQDQRRASADRQPPPTAPSATPTATIIPTPE